MKIEKGTIIEGFQFFPSVSLNWLTKCDKSRIYHLQFAWFFWYFAFCFWNEGDELY